MILKLVLIHVVILVIIWPIRVQVSAQNLRPIAKDKCASVCGNVEIPYPFGMNNSECYAGKWFEIECRNTSTHQKKPYLKSIQVEVRRIDVSKGTVWIKNPIYRTICGTKHPHTVNIQLEGSPFVYSQVQNKFFAVGCNNIAFLQSNGSSVGGCVSICNIDDKDDNYERNTDLESMISTSTCHGMHCCETSLPLYLSEYAVEIKGLNKNQTVHECSYAMISIDSEYVPDEYLQDEDYPDSNYFYIGGHAEVKNYVTAVLEWEIVNNLTTLKLPADEYAICKDTNVTSSRYKRSGKRCHCKYHMYSGNPYIAGGCPDISETSPYYYASTSSGIAKPAIIGVFASLGSIIFLLVLWRLFKIVRKNIVKKRKEKFFKQNGGLLLEQRLSSGEVNVDKVKLFSLKELEKATDYFNMNRVLGKGGQGTVYKGMLTDGKIIAVKKFKVEGKVEEFINEFVILSQINHRNVVKLLGSCLETEIPLLVYEFIPNGNLFEYLHEQNEDLPMTWNMRLRIATEVAGALFYLHSVASRPIYHRDIKSTNILLDEKYKAKVADFGTSRMISIEATHLTTVVQGTFGYLDPEYFHTSQFTEKSDVYSFGVVLVELLTGQKPISLLRPEEAKSLAPYFILCIEENRMFDIIDEKIMKEGEKEHIIAVANIASRCLELNGKKRPTMKEVTLELEGIRKLEGKSNTQERHDELELVRIEDYQSWAEYSSTSNTRPTLDLNSKTPTLEEIHILTI